MSLLQDRLRAVNAQENKEFNNNDSINNDTPKTFSSAAENKSLFKIEETKKKNKSLFFKQKNKEDKICSYNADYSPNNEELDEIEQLKVAREEKLKLKKEQLKTKIITIFLSVACAYLVFLIYGVACTKYQYNDDGVIEPQIMSVNDIKKCKNFETIQVQYICCRDLYEDILVLDYRLAQGVENPLTLAPEYEDLLRDVERLAIQINAIKPATKYEQIQQMLLTFVKTDVAIYLQKMSSAISQNNADDANTAVNYRNICYNDFSIITQNITTMGDAIKGVDVTDEKNWSPEKYINEYINGK